MSKRYNYKDEFEMLYLRHDYISKLNTPKDLETKWVREFEPVVFQTARITYNKLRPNFDKVGFDLDDIVNITNMYMLSYMGLYSIRSNTKLNERVHEKFLKRNKKEPTEEDLKRIDRNNMINFLKQRLQHCYTLCGRKARNITVGCDIRATYAFTKDSKPASNEMILEDHKKHGYRKVTKKELKEIKLLARQKGTGELADSEGFKIVEVQILNDGIKEQDYRGLFISGKNDTYHNSPEEMYVTRENETLIENFKKQFAKMSNETKVTTLKDFIKANKGRKLYKDELTAARKMLKSIKDMV